MFKIKYMSKRCAPAQSLIILGVYENLYCKKTVDAQVPNGANLVSNLGPRTQPTLRIRNEIRTKMTQKVFRQTHRIFDH